MSLLATSKALLVVAAHGLGRAEGPALVVASGPVLPDGRVGLGLVAHPAHGDQVAVGVAARPT